MKYQLSDSKEPTPSDSCYWVLPGKLLAGAYPGHWEPSAHQQKIGELLAGGVRVVVNLMEPNETDHDGKSFVPYREDIRKFDSDVQCLRFPIVDQNITTTQNMTAILDAIDESLKAGKPVYVHCWGGVGRTGTVVACWLLRHKLATHDTVISQLAALRQQDKRSRHRESPENELQHKFVQDWNE